jgi:molybdopterin-guanine dinucleotide biosynthesis protein MobB
MATNRENELEDTARSASSSESPLADSQPSSQPNLPANSLPASVAPLGPQQSSQPDEKVLAVQARLRAKLGGKVSPTNSFHGIPVVALERVASAPVGADDLTERVISELKARGFRVACLRRTAAEAASVAETAEATGAAGAQAPWPAEEYLQAGADAAILIANGCTVSVQACAEEPSLSEVAARLAADNDVVIAENVGYEGMPKILVSRKAREGFSLGLPNIIAYVSAKEDGALIPWFAPSDAAGIADLIEQRIIAPCAARKPSGERTA